MNEVEPPQIEGVFDLTARRVAKTLEQENATLRDRVLELQALAIPLDHESHGEILDGGKFECRYHPSLIVDEKTATITCRHCGAELDAFMVMLEFSKGERQFNRQNKWKLEERKALAKDIAELTKQKKNLRAAVAAANKRLVQLRAQGADA